MTSQPAPLRETFQFLGYAWDITEAERITAGRDQINVPVQQAASWLTFVWINEAHAATVDLSKPLIIAPIEDRHMPIDGFHRIWKAHRAGLDTLTAVLLTPDEEHQVRLFGGDKGQMPRRRSR